MQPIYYKEIEEKIHQLIIDKKYKNAFLICEKLLEKSPRDKNLLKLKKEILDANAKENEEAIKRGMKNAKKLLKQKKYIEATRILEKLYKLNPNDEKLKEMLIKTDSTIKQMKEQIEEDIIKKEKRRLNKILNNSPETLNGEIMETERKYRKIKGINGVIKLYREKLIEKNIRGKEDLIYSTNFRDIENFIEQLKKIDKNSPQIKDLQKMTKQRKYGEQVDTKNEFIFKGESHLTTMMQLKKFDKVIKAGEEILEIDPRNDNIKRIIKKAEKLEYKKNRDKVIKKITLEEKEAKKEYKKEPNKFLKL